MGTEAGAENDAWWRRGALSAARARRRQGFNVPRAQDKVIELVRRLVRTDRHTGGLQMFSGGSSICVCRSHGTGAQSPPGGRVAESAADGGQRGRVEA